MTSSLSILLIRLAESGEEEAVNHGLSWGIGGIALAVLLSLLAVLLTFGGGREHT